MKKEDVHKYDRIIGIDVAKSTHHYCAVDSVGDVILSGTFSSDERSIVDALRISSADQTTLVVVDQHRSFGAAVVRCAFANDLDIACVAPKDFAVSSELWSEDKTDVIDAYVLSQIPLTFPKLANLIMPPDKALEELRETSALRKGCVGERTKAYNRLHDLLCRMCPSWESILTKDHLHTKQALTLLSKYGSPSALKRSGKRACSWIEKQPGCGASAKTLTQNLLERAQEQKIAIPAEQALGRQVSSLAKRLLDLEAQCKELEAAIEGIGQSIPMYMILRSIPGFGTASSAIAACAIEDITRFKSPAKLATYAGMSAKNHESGSSVHGKRKRKGGNRDLKAVLYNTAAVAAMNDGPSKDYYQRKRREGKNHVQAVRALARQRINVVFALLKKGEMFNPALYA